MRRILGSWIAPSALVVFLTCACSTASVIGPSDSQMGPGISGGTLRWGYTNQYAIAVPDSYTVVDVRNAMQGRTLEGCLYVVAGMEIRRSRFHEEYVSEVWRFSPPDSGSSTTTFEDREVLLSLRTPRSGRKMYVSTISCVKATAVQVNEAGPASTVVLELGGGSATIDAAAITKASGRVAPIVCPVTWIEEGGKWVLICHAWGQDGHFLVYYTVGGGDLVVVPAAEAWGKAGSRALEYFDLRR